MAITLIAPDDQPNISAKAAVTVRDAPSPGSRFGPNASLIPYTPSSELLAITDWTPEDYEVFRHYLARREGASYTEPKNVKGYGARYGFNEEDVNKTAKRLGIPAPNWKEFQDNPALQERFLDDYTLANAQELMKNKTYTEASPIERAGILAGAHLGGVKGVERYLAGGLDPGDNDKAPGGGTHISSYVLGMAQTMRTGVFTAPGWNPSQRAIASEQDRSNTDVVGMTPEEFLDLLPPIPDDEGTRAKRANLRKSLLAGDDIEAIPALEVQPTKKGGLRIVDHDGRNRAEEAANSGVDEIPVAIRGATPGGSYTDITGTRTAPYAFSKIPKAEPVPITPTVPSPPVPPGVAAPGAAPGRLPGTAPPPIAMPPTKPDFYPQIAAGINRAQLIPAAEPYRGLAVLNPADQNTAGDRIAAANATSAGKMGLAPNAPQNALSSLLSAVNPIGSAQAAEVPGQAPLPPGAAMAPLPPRNGGITLTPPQEDTGGVTLASPEAPPLSSPHSLIPGPEPALNALSEGVVHPLGNFLTAPLRYLGADIYGAAMGAARGGLPGLSPASPEFQAARQQALNYLTMPENRVGNAVSTLLSAPGIPIALAAKAVMLAGDAALNKPLGTTAGVAEPYLGVGMDVAGFAGLHPRAANVLTAPLAPVLQRYSPRPPEQIGPAQVNRAEASELRAGGTPPLEIAKAMQDANASGIPLAPIDFILANEGQARLLAQSLEASPESRANLRNFLKSRTEGTKISSALERVGGSLDRLTRHVEDAFGTKSAYDLQKEITDSVEKLNPALSKAKQVLSEEDALISVREKQIRKANPGLGPRQLDTMLLRDPTLIRSRISRDGKSHAVDQLESQLEDKLQEQQALKLGQRIYLPSVTPAAYSRKLTSLKNRQTARSEIYRALRTGIGDTVKNRLRSVRTLGTEASTVDAPQNIRNKLSTSFENLNAAENFMNKVDYEGQIVDSSAAGLRILGGESREEALAGSRLRRAAESVGHLGSAFVLPGLHSHMAAYWGLRSARNIADYLTGGGRGIRASTRGRAAVNAMIDPNANIGSGRNLLAMPPMSRRREQVIEGVRRALPFTLPGQLLPEQESLP